MPASASRPVKAALVNCALVGIEDLGFAEARQRLVEGVDGLYATAERGWFELSPAYSYSGLKGRTSEGSMSFSDINQQAAQMDAIASAILNDEPSPVPGEEELKDPKVIEAIYRSGRLRALKQRLSETKTNARPTVSKLHIKNYVS